VTSLLALIGFVGVLFRETVILAPAAAFAACAWRGLAATTWPASLLRRAVPLAAAAAAVAVTHAIVIPRGRYTFTGQAAQMLQAQWENPLGLLLSPLAAFGPVVLLPLVFFRVEIVDFCRRFPIVPIYGFAVLMSAWLGGYHGVRLLFPGTVAVLPLVGVALAFLVKTGPAWFRLCLFLPLAIAQILATNPFGVVPDLTATDQSAAVPTFYTFFPYGSEANYKHLWPHAMGTDLQWRMLLQYAVLGLYLFSLRIYASRRGWLPRGIVRKGPSLED
jgi:hypothetical protein